mgnify:CR=1 FL=1
MDSSLPPEVYECSQELAGILGNKNCLYDFFSNNQKLFLPDYQSIELPFLVQVLAGEKKLLTLEQANQIHFEDNLCISRDRIQQYCLETPKLRKYVPEIAVNRDYLMKLIAVLDRETLEALSEVSAAKSKSQNSGSSYLKIVPEYAEILLRLPKKKAPKKRRGPRLINQ